MNNNDYDLNEKSSSPQETMSNENSALIKKLCSFLELEVCPCPFSDKVYVIRYFSLVRMFKAIGISCEWNINSPFLRYCSTILGEAISQKLNLGIRVADDKYRLFKFNGINLVNSVRDCFENVEIMDEAMINAFDIIDDNRAAMNM